MITMASSSALVQHHGPHVDLQMFCGQLHLIAAGGSILHEVVDSI